MTQRLRVRYTKRGRVRFLSARDLTSVWERALRRAQLPIAYSEGFTPHPKISFPDALPVGFASTGEYAELTFAAAVDPGPALGRLSAALPTGMDLTTFLTVPDGARKLASYLKATLWEFTFDAAGPIDGHACVDELHRRITQLMAAPHVDVMRHRKSGDVSVDLRPAVLAMTATLRGSHPQPIPAVRAVFRNDGPTVRPTDLASALSRFADRPLPDPRGYTRVAQGRWTDEGLVEALTQHLERLEPDRQGIPA